MTRLTRRSLLGGCLCCAGSGLGCAPAAPPLAPGERPTAETDEGGLWAIMDRQEARLSRSPLLIKDQGLERYVRSIACTVAGPHCQDIRIYVVRNAAFNASMAPNGMMQIWSGLLLRAENEAQLAAVIGHEMGHFIGRHMLTRMRSIRTVGDVAAFLGLGLGAAGVPGGPESLQIIAIASLFSYSRDQERDADAFGLKAMAEAGYAPREAARVWAGLMAEQAADDQRDREPIPFLATHPSSEEREATLRQMAALMPSQGRTGEEVHAAALAPVMPVLLADEVRRRRPERSLSILHRLIAKRPSDAALRTAEGEVYRLRGAEGDDDRALASFRAAIDQPRPPAVAWRGIGLIEHRRGHGRQARAAFERYLASTPEPTDAAMIRTYMVEGS